MNFPPQTVAKAIVCKNGLPVAYFQTSPPKSPSPRIEGDLNMDNKLLAPPSWGRGWGEA